MDLSETDREGTTLNRARVLELVIGARRSESFIGSAIPGGKLDKKWQINFSPAYLFNPPAAEDSTAVNLHFTAVIPAEDAGVPRKNLRNTQMYRCGI